MKASRSRRCMSAGTTRSRGRPTPRSCARSCATRWKSSGRCARWLTDPGSPGEGVRLRATAATDQRPPAVGSSQSELWVVLVGRADMAEGVEDLGEEVEQTLEDRHVANHAAYLEVELVHVRGELRPEDAFAVLHLEVEPGHGQHHLAEPGGREQREDLGSLVTLDDEGVVELPLAHLDVLHPELLRQRGKEPLAIDLEAEAVRVHVRRPHPRERRRALAGGHGVGVEGDGPRLDLRLDLVAAPETTVGIRRADLLGELPPHLLPVRPGNGPKRIFVATW